MTVRIQQQRFIKTTTDRVAHCKYRVEILPTRFGGRGHHLRVKLEPGRYGNPHALFKALRAQVSGPRPGKNHDLDRTFGWMDSKSAAAVVTKRSHITTAELISLDSIADRLGKFFSLIRNLDPVNTSRVVKPFEVGIEPEDCRTLNGLVTTHAFEDAATVVQSMRGNVRIG